MVKEELLKFDGTPLFPVRRAYTVPYKLSAAEASLYDAVTHYVQQEFDRAETTRRKEAHDSWVRPDDPPAPTRLIAPSNLPIAAKAPASAPGPAEGAGTAPGCGRLATRRYSALPNWTWKTLEDLEDAPESEFEAREAEVVDQATAARSSEELRAEINTGHGLEQLAREVLDRSDDTKWRELAGLLGKIFTPTALTSRINEPVIRYGAGDVPPPQPSPGQKLVIFTEHKDTLNYLNDRITTLIGRPEAVVVIHGGAEPARPA